MSCVPHGRGADPRAPPTTQLHLRGGVRGASLGSVSRLGTPRGVPLDTHPFTLSCGHVSFASGERKLKLESCPSWGWRASHGAVPAPAPAVVHPEPGSSRLCPPPLAPGPCSWTGPSSDCSWCCYPRRCSSRPRRARSSGPRSPGPCPGTSSLTSCTKKSPMFGST